MPVAAGAALHRMIVAAAVATAALVSAGAADGRISDERTLTYWAHTNQVGPVRAAPRTGSRSVANLRFRTEDGLPEVYLVLERRNGWLRIRVPGRPNGRTGWVRSDRLSALRSVTTQLVVDRRRLVATLRRDGRIVWRSRIGVGKPGTTTPRGHFWVRERLRNLDGAPLYGPWAFATAAYSDTLSDWPGGGVIGIHGTDQPWLLPGRVSHGCVRVPNRAIRRLARLLPIGTPVLIR